jgi:Outer membrane protein beta-barrel domain
MKAVLVTLLLTALLITFSSPSYSQYRVGRNTASASVGFGGGGLTGTGAIPISVEFNFLNFEKNIHAGLYASYSSTSEDLGYYNSSGKWKYTYIVIAAQGNWHFTPGEKFDPFAGISLGYRIATVSWSWNGAAGPYTPTSASASDIFFSAQAGFNYWFSDNFAAQVRVGYFPYASVGVTLGL